MAEESMEELVEKAQKALKLLRDMQAYTSNNEEGDAMAVSKDVVTTEMTYDGDKILVPQGMTYEKAIEVLDRARKRDMEEMSFHREYNYHPYDGARALGKAIEKKFGFACTEREKTMFGTRPPTMVSVEVGYGKHESIIWGIFSFPGMKVELQSGGTMKRNRAIYVLSGKYLRKHKAVVDEVAEMVEEELRTNSIYRGKSMKMKFNDLDGGFATPEFLDISKVRADGFILPRDIEEQVAMSIFTPIQHTEVARKNKIPLKRGVLLYGPYGTGKTLIAHATSRVAVDNGWTFMYVMDDLEKGLETALQYQPCVVFYEDIDRIAADRKSDASHNLINLMDGVLSKNSEVMLVLTTNEVTKIHPAALRHGRLDAVIPINPPDAEAVGRLIRMYGGNLVDKDDSFDIVGAMLAGEIPAMIRETIERAKLAAIMRSEGKGKIKLTEDDLIVSARSQRAHSDLLKSHEPDTRTTMEKFGQIVGGAIRDGMTKCEQVLDIDSITPVK